MEVSVCCGMSECASMCYCEIRIICLFVYGLEFVC